MTRLSVPTPTSEGSLATDSMEMHYRVYGQGPPLVLLHGFFGAGVLWDPFVGQLDGYQVIVPDLRGHGRSTNVSGVFTHRQSAKDVFALLDHLGHERFRAIGDSTGAMTLLHMATQQPQRIEAMILVGATLYYPPEARYIIGQTTFEGYTPEYLATLRQRHVRGDAQIRALVEQFRGFETSYDDMNFTPPYLDTIMARTLIVHGDRDQCFPVAIPVQMYRAIPNAALWIVPNSTHSVLTERFGATEAGRTHFCMTARTFLSGTPEG